MTKHVGFLRLVALLLSSLLVAFNIKLSFHYSHEKSSPPDGVLQDYVVLPRIEREASFAVPPLKSIVSGWNITGDASWLLQFAIVGFPKSGTSSLMFHLRSHPEVKIFEDERCDLSYNRQAVLIRDLYLKFQPIAPYVRGIKCPFDLENPRLAIPNYQKFFPKTNFIVGIRHPVLWFESFYNFRVHNQFPIDPPHELIGLCRRGSFNVCTFRSNFHLFLSNFGKTHLTSEERSLMGLYQRLINPQNVSRPVFLYEVSQLSDTNETRAELMRADLQSFLRLREPISPVIWYRPGRNHTSKKTLKEVNARKINICEAQYDDIRALLQEQAFNASKWIRNYFIYSPTVKVSSKDYFLNVIMKSWEHDPCLDRERKRDESGNSRRKTVP